MGVYKPLMKPMWSWWAMRTEAVAVLYWGLAGKVLLEHLQGTPFLPWCCACSARSSGAASACSRPTSPSSTASRSATSAPSTPTSALQTHLYEDRVMKVGRVTLGRGVTVGANATVLYDTHVGDFARLRPLTIVMKGESIPAHTEVGRARRPCRWCTRRRSCRRRRERRHCRRALRRRTPFLTPHPLRLAVLPGMVVAGRHGLCGGSALHKTIIIAAAFMLGATGAEAQTPRKGGTIRMTAPYGSSFTSMDIHTTQRAQDEIYAKGLHRSLYIWNSAEGKPVPELAKEAVVSGGGLVHTFKLRDDAYFHHGRKMTADDVIWTYNRIMDGTKAYPGARYVRVIEGAAEVEKGQAKEISGLKKIDDFTLEMKLTEKVDPGFYFFTALTSIYPADEAAKESFIQKPIGLGPFKFVEHVPGSRIVLERWDKFYKPGKPYADKIDRVADGRGRGARCRLPQQGDRHLGARTRAVCRLSGRPQPQGHHRRSRRGLHPLHGDESRRSSRSPTSGSGRRSTMRSIPT